MSSPREGLMAFEVPSNKGSAFSSFLQVTGNAIDIAKIEARNKILVAPVQLGGEKNKCSFNEDLTTVNGLFNPWLWSSLPSYGIIPEYSPIKNYLNRPGIEAQIGLSFGGALVWGSANIEPFDETTICTPQHLLDYIIAVNQTLNVFKIGSKLNQIDFNVEGEHTFKEGKAWNKIGKTIRLIKHYDPEIKISITIPQISSWDVAAIGYTQPSFKAFFSQYYSDIDYIALMILGSDGDDISIMTDRFIDPVIASARVIQSAVGNEVSIEAVKSKIFLVLDSSGFTNGNHIFGRHAKNLNLISDIRKFYQDKGFNDLTFWLTLPNEGEDPSVIDNLNYNSTSLIAN